MRMRSCKLPVWLTVFVFLRPAFYVLFRVNKLEIFNWSELGEYVLGAILVTIVIWLFYGIFCLVAKPLQGASTGKSIDPTREPGQDVAITAILATHDIVRGQCKKCRCTEYYIKTNKHKCPK